jgi:hypothetical protein
VEALERAGERGVGQARFARQAEVSGGELGGEQGAERGLAAPLDEPVGDARERAHHHHRPGRPARQHLVDGDAEVGGDAHRGAAELHDDHAVLLAEAALYNSPRRCGVIARS